MPVVRQPDGFSPVVGRCARRKLRYPTLLPGLSVDDEHVDRPKQSPIRVGEPATIARPRGTERSSPKMLDERSNAASVERPDGESHSSIAAGQIGEALPIRRRCGGLCVIEHFLRLSA